MAGCAKIFSGVRKEEIRHILRALLPVAAAVALLFGGVAALLKLNSSGNGEDMIWFWPAALGCFLLTWLLFRTKWGNWVSPKVFLFVSAPVLALLLSAYVVIPYLPTSVSAKKGERVNLSGEFYSVDGKPVYFDDYAGKLIFLNFWATWCGPCRAEMPSMAGLHQELSDQGLAIIAVTDEDPETVRSYLEREPYPFAILLDPKGTLFRRLQVRALPTTFVINAQDQIVLEHQGGYRWDTPRTIDKFRQLLAE